MRVSPERKSKLPSARSAPSKKSMTPSIINRDPNVVSATPIFCVSESHIMAGYLSVSRADFLTMGMPERQRQGGRLG